MQKDFFDELDNELSGVPVSQNSVKETPLEEVKNVISQPQAQKTEAVEEKKQFPKNKNFNNKKQPRQFHQKQPRSSIDEESSVGEDDGDEERNFNDDHYNFKNNILANFPQTKFYMPTLRDGYTRFIPI